jgi:hypothetical protein
MMEVNASSEFLLRLTAAITTRLRRTSLSPVRVIALARATALASVALLMLPGAWGHSVTIVEYAHLPAGLSVWQRHALGNDRVCGPLSKLLYALPAYLAGVRVDYPAAYDVATLGRREWDVGLLFEKQQRDFFLAIFRWSRMLPILVTILGGCLVCEWGTRLLGAWPGTASLCVWCWMPLILGHGSLRPRPGRAPTRRSAT